MEFVAFYHTGVENDIFRARDWYKNQRDGLETRFSKEVKSTIQQIISDPFIFQKKYKEVRIAYTKIFPFGIHFRVNDVHKEIIILGVFHTSVNPKKWEKRL
ncbi:type II toxin-antitoxin system RelE/ParE family toxin [Sinomicrobium sp.]